MKKLITHHCFEGMNGEEFEGKTMRVIKYKALCGLILTDYFDFMEEGSWITITFKVGHRAEHYVNSYGEEKNTKILPPACFDEDLGLVNCPQCLSHRNVPCILLNEVNL